MHANVGILCYKHSSFFITLRRYRYFFQTSWMSGVVNVSWKPVSKILEKLLKSTKQEVSSFALNRLASQLNR